MAEAAERDRRKAEGARRAWAAQDLPLARAIIGDGAWALGLPLSEDEEAGGLAGEMVAAAAGAGDAPSIAALAASARADDPRWGLWGRLRYPAAQASLRALRSGSAAKQAWPSGRAAACHRALAEGGVYPGASAQAALDWALGQACSWAETEPQAVEALLEAGASPDAAARPAAGVGCLSEAAKAGNAPAVRALARGGASLGARCAAGMNALGWAARSGVDETILILLEAGMDPREPQGASPNAAAVAREAGKERSAWILEAWAERAALGAAQGAAPRSGGARL